ncbi:MAG: DMT family transporter [Bacteroidia bacterium]|nr:DMT family transporter [Bacteroidia bacterium]
MTKGVKSILIATLFFSAMNVLVKMLSHIPAVELALFRSVFTLITSYFIIKKLRLSVFGNKNPILYLRGLLGTFSLIFFFKSLHYLPLATATLVHYLTPFFTTFFGYLFLKEKFYKIQWFFLFICFAGILITQHDKGIFNTFNIHNSGLLFGMGASVAAAGAYNCIRKISAAYNPNIIMIYFPIMAIPICSIVLLINGGFIIPSFNDWFLILIMAVLTQAAQYYLTIAYQNEKVGNIAVYTNLGIVYAVANGIIFFNEIPTFNSWIGIIIVVLGIILNLFSDRIFIFFKSFKNEFVK